MTSRWGCASGRELAPREDLLGISGHNLPPRARALLMALRLRGRQEGCDVPVLAVELELGGGAGDALRVVAVGLDDARGVV